jgi:serine/threonine protein kinase
MAPEMLQEKKYTEKVDVYSFGIILSEILSMKPPFDGVKTWDIPDLVIEGKRPELPKKLPAKLRDLTVACWHQTPKKRPTFAAIYDKLRAILAKADRL